MLSKDIDMKDHFGSFRSNGEPVYVELIASELYVQWWNIKKPQLIIAVGGGRVQKLFIRKQEFISLIIRTDNWSVLFGD